MTAHFDPKISFLASFA